MRVDVAKLVFGSDEESRAEDVDDIDEVDFLMKCVYHRKVLFPRECCSPGKMSLVITWWLSFKPQNAGMGWIIPRFCFYSTDCNLFQCSVGKIAPVPQQRARE